MADLAAKRRPFNVNENINEYLFARVIEDHNIDARRNGGELITTTRARALHKDWLTAIGSVSLNEQTGEKASLLTAKPSLIKQTVSSVLGPYLDDNSPWKDPSSSECAYARMNYLNEWMNITGISVVKGPERDARLRDGVIFGPDNAIPCSPYAERYVFRDTVMDQGSRILYMMPQDMLVQERDASGNFMFYEPEQSLSEQMKNGVQFYSQVFRRDRGDDVDTRTEDYTLRAVGPAVTSADVAGITPLRQYMSDEEFEKARRWTEVVPERDRMTPRMVERSVAVLEMLQNEGISYKVEPDRNPGQLRASIDRSKISIRLTDTVKNQSYIGRVYNDGVSFWMKPYYNGKNSGSYEPSIEDLSSVINYALGRSVPRRIIDYRSKSGHQTPCEIKSLAGNIGSPSNVTKKGETVSKRTTYLGPDNNGKLKLVALAGTAPVKDDQGNVSNLYLSVYTQNAHSNPHLNFATGDEAYEFLSEAVDSARKNFVDRVNVDYLISEYNEHKDEEGYVPMLAGDPSIRPIQLAYWNVLTGRQELYRPDDQLNLDSTFDSLFDMFDEDDDDEFDMNGDDESESERTISDAPEINSADFVYSLGSAEENIRQHLKDHVDATFGSMELDEFGRGFSPSLVARFMEQDHGVARNKDNLIAAMSKLGYTGEELRGDDFETGGIKDRLLRFDFGNARPMKEAAENSEYMRLAMDSVKTALNDSACDVNDDDILIDPMGVVHYKAKIRFTNERDRYLTLEGDIGQIFEPDKDTGLVETRYNGSKNRLFVPGFEAYIVPEEQEGQPLEERYRFKGLPQVLVENIQRQIRSDIHSVTETVDKDMNADTIVHTGTSTSINGTYRGLYHTSHKVMIQPEPEESLKDAFLRQQAMAGMDKDTLLAILNTERGMVHFPKDMVEGSSVNAWYRADSRQARMDSVPVHDLANDNRLDFYEYTNHANLSITCEHSDNLFDPTLTGSGKNQGAIRYFVTGAGVDASGKPIFAENENARAPIMGMEIHKYADFCPPDRQQMSGSNTMSAIRIVDRVGFAMVNCGWNFDDGVPVSKKFAEQYGVWNDKGELRGLMVGDKLCTPAGNKSIIGTVIDPDMPDEEAEAKGVGELVKLFRANPDLDCAFAPYSPVGRFNMADVRFALNDHEDLTMPNGSAVEGGIGYGPMIITKHTAEDHTKNYDEDDVKQGRGRKISAQQSWMLCAKNATAMMTEIFGPNNGATVNFREYLNVLGFDMSECGDICYGYEPHRGEKRYMFELPDSEALAVMEKRDMADAFADVVGSKGGIMELPFPLKLVSGYDSEPLEGRSCNGHPSYGLNVMSSHLRSGLSFDDGSKVVHDYTNYYQRIYESAISYMTAERKLASATEEEKPGLRYSMDKSMQTAQQAYDNIAEDVVQRKFASKHNIARDELMTRRMPNSATAIWSADPTLKANQIGLSEGIAKALNVKAGDRVLVNRDPLLRTYGMRDMEVVVTDKHGATINPLMAYAFDGDFDGDSCGIQVMRTEAAKKEAYKLFSFEQNMLDFSKDRGNGDYGLIMNVGMDVVSAEVDDEERKARELDALRQQYGDGTPEYIAHASEVRESLRERRLSIEHEFNEVYRDKSLSDDERAARNCELTDKLSDYMTETLTGQGHTMTECLSFASPAQYAESVLQFVDHGAKGSVKKVLSCMKYAGFDVKLTDDKRPDLNTIVDTGHPLATEQDMRDTQLATGIKAMGTGIAGAHSQRCMGFTRNLPNNVAESALRLSYLATQGILQSKHDAVKARLYYSMVREDIRFAWRGYALDKVQKDGFPRWTPRYENGKIVQATKEEWIQNFMDMHSAPEGLDLGGSISRYDVERVADALVGPDGRMLNIEDENTMHKYMSPIDYLAYNQTNAVDYLKWMADNARNLFEGVQSRNFAPEQVRRNMEFADRREWDRFIALQPPDTGVSPAKVRPGLSIIEMDMKQVTEDVMKAPSETQSGSFKPVQYHQVGTPNRPLPKEPSGMDAADERLKLADSGESPNCPM